MSNNYWMKPVDFFARRAHFVDHLAPIYAALDPSIRGKFYVPAILFDTAVAKGIDAVALKSRGVNDPTLVVPEGEGPLVVCGYGDLQIAHRKQPKRPMIYLEHGVGLSFNHPAYSGGKGVKRSVSLFLDPNEHVRAKNQKAFPQTDGFVIGTPKLDRIFTPPFVPPQIFAKNKGAEYLEMGKKSVVCISFHWDGKAVAAEAGNALAHYKSVLAELAQQDDFVLIGHGHPRIVDVLERTYKSLGIEFVRDFEEVMERADLYVNDCSSTLYEFCATGKPVVILNAPNFRKNVHHGIRFWQYADVGPQVEEAKDLLSVIREQLDPTPDPSPNSMNSERGVKEAYEVARAKAVQDLYPYWGCAAERASEVILEYVNSKRPELKTIEKVDGESIGLLYMCFGEKAAKAVQSSINSLKSVGLDLRVCVVGDTPVAGAFSFIEWKGESPFDAEQRENFQFRAGRIKPHLYDLSPFERTLYVDADTEFMSDIISGFEMLSEYDMALAEESLAIGKLYNKPRAGWEINILERNETVAFIGGDAGKKFLNSGVIFFRKCDAVEAVFAEWSSEWMRYQQWDEQLALMRAMHNTPVKYKALSIDWNHPHRDKAKIIFHNYGRGVVRVNVAPSATHVADISDGGMTPPRLTPLPAFYEKEEKELV